MDNLRLDLRLDLRIEDSRFMSLVWWDGVCRFEFPEVSDSAYQSLIGSA